MHLKASTIQNQTNAANYCRTGENPAIEGVAPGRMQHYRRLVNSVFHDTLESAFPIASDLLTEDQWGNLVDAFMMGHKARTPQIWKLPFEFVEYVMHNDWAAQLEEPYLNDLLLFEWLEIDVHTMQDIVPEPYDTEGNWQKDAIVVTRECIIQPLQYPVHRIAAAESVGHKGKYYVLIFRTADNGEVKFVDLSPLLVFVVEKLKQQPTTVQQLTQQVSLLFNIENQEYVSQQIAAFLQKMRSIGFVLGFAPPDQDI